MLSAIRQRLEDRANQHVGLLAEFSDPGALVHAVEDLREKGYSQIDTFTPFPIHGMDRAMGLPVSKLGFLVFGGAATGGFLGWALQYWTSEVDYAINISNKPLFAWESSIPIMFELTILFAALTAVGGMLALNGLPKPYNPLFNSERFSRATDDAFFVHVSTETACSRARRRLTTCTAWAPCRWSTSTTTAPRWWTLAARPHSSTRQTMRLGFPSPSCPTTPPATSKSDE